MDWSTTLQGARVRASATAPLKPFESICSTARLHLSDAQQPGLDTPHVQRAAAKVKSSHASLVLASRGTEGSVTVSVQQQ